MLQLSRIHLCQNHTNIDYVGSACQECVNFLRSTSLFPLTWSSSGVTQWWRPFGMTNTVLVYIREKETECGGGGARLSLAVYSCAHGSPIKLWWSNPIYLTHRSSSFFLCSRQSLCQDLPTLAGRKARVGAKKSQRWQKMCALYIFCSKS